jgi:hypothetical protein
MCPTLNTVPVWCTQGLRLALLFMVLFVSACTSLGHGVSNPSSMPPEGGYAGANDPSNGGGGY